MTDTEAFALANRFQVHWRLSNTDRDGWIRFLAGFEHGSAVATFQRFVGPLAYDSAPSFTRFGSEYEMSFAVPVEPEPPRLSREQRNQILRASGCPERLIRAPKETTND